MKTKILLEKPCAVSLSKMQRVPGGVFCSHCQHTVKDLTVLNENEFADWKKKTNGEKACGIYRKDQYKLPAKQWLFPLKFAAATFLAFFATKKSGAQTAPVALPLPETDSSKTLSIHSDSVMYNVTGKAVLEKDNSPCAYLHIRVIYDGRTIASTLTEADGSFVLHISGLEGQSYRIEASSFEYKELVIETYKPDGKPLLLKTVADISCRHKTKGVKVKYE